MGRRHCRKNGHRRYPGLSEAPGNNRRQGDAAAPSPDRHRRKKKLDDAFNKGREGRITGSAFAIAWSIILLVFFNFYYEYAAYYSADTVGGMTVWTKEPFFTSEINLWLPILTTTLTISIICHIIMIIVDRNLLRKSLLIITDGFGLATVVTLLTVFPFDFDVIPNTVAAASTDIAVTVVLICISVGMGISLLVRVVKLLVDLAKAASTA